MSKFSMLAFRPRNPGVDPTGGFYSPGRDFAYCYPRTIRVLYDAFNKSYWPELVRIVEEQTARDGKDGWNEICKAHDQVHHFLQIFCEDPSESFEDVMKRSGLRDVHPAALFGWMAMFGIVSFGQLFACVRDVNPLGTSPPEVIARYLNVALTDVRRGFNFLGKKEELADEFRNVVRIMRKEGESFDTIRQLVDDVELGRTAEASA